MRKLLVKYAVLCVVLLLVGCSKEAEYSKVIPSDVDVVATFDCQRMIAESGMLSDDATDSQKQLIESFKKELSAGETELFDEILADPNSVGIDWSQKVYGFIQSNSRITAFVLSVTDAEKLKAACLAFGGSQIRGRKFTQEDGFSWARTRKMDIAINDKACILVTSAGSEKIQALKERIASWLSQEKEQSFVSTKYHKMLLDLDGEVGLYASMTALPENASMMASMAYTKDVDISSVKYLVDVAFEKGQLVAHGQVLYEDSKFRDWMKSQEDACKTLDAKSLKALPLSTPLWFGVGIDGNTFYNHLLEHPTYGKELQNMSLPLDIEGVIRSIDGDFAVAYPSGIFVDVKNNEILKICVGAIKTMGRFIGLDLNEIADDQYEVVDLNHSVSRLLGKDAQLHIGMKDDTFYLLTDGTENKELSKDESLAAAPWADEVDDNTLFLAFNFCDGMNLVDRYSRSKQQSKMLRNYFDYLTYSQKNIEKNKIILSFVDKDRNVIEQLIEFYAQMN